MKKKNITFADKANKIINKYKLRLGKNLEKHDPLAMKGLERELDALKAEQDTFKQQQEQQQIANQFVPEQQIQMPQYQFGNTYDDPPTGINPELYDDSENMYRGKTYYNSDYPLISNDRKYESVPSLMQKNLDYQNPNENVPTVENEKLKSIPSVSTSTEDMIPYDYSEDYTPYNPTLGGVSPIPLIDSLAGSYLAYKSAKPSDINYDRITPEEIDLSSERENARRQADTSRLMALRNARGLGLNAGAIATLGTASQEAIDTSLGSTLGKSYLNESLTNSRNRQRANQINANISMKEKDSRLREHDAVMNIRQQAIQDAIQNMNMYFSNVQKGKRFNDYMNTKDTVYNRYEDPNQTGLGRLFNPRYVEQSNPNIINRYR